MAQCHFDSHGKRHQPSELFFFLNFRDSSKLAFQYTRTHVFFFMCTGFLGVHESISKSRTNAFPKAQDKLLSSRNTNGGLLLPTGEVGVPKAQRGNGLQPMNTKHGEATGKLTNRLKRAYFSHYQNQHRCQTSQHPNLDVIC